MVWISILNFIKIELCIFLQLRIVAFIPSLSFESLFKVLLGGVFSWILRESNCISFDYLKTFKSQCKGSENTNYVDSNIFLTINNWWIDWTEDTIIQFRKIRKLENNNFFLLVVVQSKKYFHREVNYFWESLDQRMALRFKYPEKCIIFLNLSYNILRWVLCYFKIDNIYIILYIIYYILIYFIIV